MDYLTSLVLLSFLLACIHIFISTLCSQSSKPPKRPPGPSPFPIIGNILELVSNPHQSLTALSKTYGPIMTLKLGTLTTIVIASPHMAKESLHKNDLALSSRPIQDSIRSHNHHEHSIVHLPASAKWKTFRRVCAKKIFSPQQLDSTQIICQRKVNELINYVNERCKKGKALDIGEVVFTTVLNSISNTYFSLDLAHYSSAKSQEFKNIIWGIMEELGRPNVADYFPILRLLDPQGIRARTKKHFGKLLNFFDGIIEERMRLRASNMDSKACNDVIDSFLNLHEDSQLSRCEMLHLFQDLFIGGIDTTSTTVEWAMTELMRNPEKLSKAKVELRQVLGKDGKVEESHISKLPYLQAVMKETLRLHPAVPFLIPHKSETDVQIGGFTVPKNAQILINVWAMGRNSSVWENPDLFEPERFFQSGIDFKGSDFELIPFGAGRRICPGLPLANRTVPLILGSLLHSFDWTLADGIKPKDLEMREKFGLTLKRAQPLVAIAIKE